jgi:hypothetical protein
VKKNLFKIVGATLFILLTFGLFSQKTSTTKDYKNLSILCNLLISSFVDTTSNQKIKTSKEINFDNLNFVSDSTVDKNKEEHYKITVDQNNQIKMIAFYEGKKFVYKLLRLTTPKEVVAFSIVRKDFTWSNEPDKAKLLPIGYLVTVDRIHFTLDYIGGHGLIFKNLMFVNDKLQTKSYCIFEKGRMTHVAQPDYSLNSICRVILYVPFENETLDKNTSISHLKMYDRKLLDEVCSYLTCTNVSINQDFCKYPLWLFRDFTYRCK